MGRERERKRERERRESINAKMLMAR